MTKVHNNLQASRYEFYAEGLLAATLSYSMDAGRMWMLSVETLAVEPPLKRTDGFLVGVFRDVHRRRLEVLPFSPAVRNFMVENNAYLHLLPKRTPGHFPDLRRAAEAERLRRAALKRSKRKQMVPARFFEGGSGRSVLAVQPKFNVAQRGRLHPAGGVQL